MPGDVIFTVTASRTDCARTRRCRRSSLSWPKEASGHDERLTCAEVVRRLLDEKTWGGADGGVGDFPPGHATRQAGLVLVDTKYEFGRAPDGTVMLIDRCTPRTLPVWKLDTYQESFEG
jgi:hypothetical protein